MKKIFSAVLRAFMIAIMVSPVVFIGCKKNDSNIKFPNGIFPDTVLNLQGINSAYDDYNTTAYTITGAVPLIFSSNRKSTGGQFDLEQGVVVFTFDKTTGRFDLSAEMTQDSFVSGLITKAVTSKNDFGPYRTYSSYDGMEYLILASENSDGNLDLKYLTNVPPFGSALPEIYGPYPVKLLNTAFDDAYLTFDLNLDTAYFNSNPEGNFDIYLKSRPANMDISAWFNSDYSAPVKVDNINSTSDDKCPMVYNKLMVFTSNRPGGYGGYDLYYSIFENGNWGTPVNFGSKINSSSDEYRPLIGFHSDFTNLFMIFSSNRPGGSGGYDLYFTGINNPAN